MVGPLDDSRDAAGALAGAELLPMGDERIEVEYLPRGAEADPSCARCGRLALSRLARAGRRIRFRRGPDVLCLECAGPWLDRAGLLLALSIAMEGPAAAGGDA